MEKMLYSIGEVAKILAENVTTVRYWSNYFSKWLKPTRGGRGDRKFSPEDVDTLKFIHREIRIGQMHLEGVAEKLRNRKAADPKDLVLDRLIEIKKSLEELRANL